MEEARSHQLGYGDFWRPRSGGYDRLTRAGVGGGTRATIACYDRAALCPRALACQVNMEALGTWRDLEALATGRRTTDLRPDEGTGGDDGSVRDLSRVDGTTTTLLLDNNNLKQFVFSQLQLRALHTLSLSSNRLRCLDPGIASFAASLTVLKLECNALRSLPGATCDLGRLEVLWLGCNELEELPARLGRLGRLRELCVDTNKLRTLPPSLGDLRLLETLSAETNMLRELPVAA